MIKVMIKTINIEPFARVEGDLKIKIDVKDNVVTDAKVSGIMFRGFEKMLKNHPPEDILVYLPRICGICSVSHSVAAAKALASISEDFEKPINGYLATNLAHATENVMSHITQFYMYFAPDLVNDRYKKFSIFKILEKRLSQFHGESVKKIMAERKRFLEIIGLICGKWPHSLAIQPGGITKHLTSSDIFRIIGTLSSFKHTLEECLFGLTIENFLKIRTVSDFKIAFDQRSGNKADLAIFYQFSELADFFNLGKGPGKLLSGGCYNEGNGNLFLKSGYWDGIHEVFDPSKITELTTYSFFKDEQTFSPVDSTSIPDLGKDKAYSWSKAPRYNDNVVEVGALARGVISKDFLLCDFFSQFGSTVFTRLFARLHETAKLIDAMQKWTNMIDPAGKFYIKNNLKKDCKGFGIVEAARGFLGHWISVKDGKIANLQVITPTAWNASPMDDKGRPGPIESSLIKTKLADENKPLETEHIIRSFDPCLVCTVH